MRPVLTLVGAPSRGPGQRRVGVVDLGHPPGGSPRSRRVVAGQVRVVRPGEAPPGCLDLRRRGARLTPSTSLGSRLAIALSVGHERLAPRPRDRASRLCPALDRPGRVPSPTRMGIGRRIGIAARSPPRTVRTRVPLRPGLSRSRRVSASEPAAGHTGRPRACRSSPRWSMSDGIALPAWFIPARGGQPGPGVVLVHGWESARDRTLPMAVFLHAAGLPLPDLRRPRPWRQPGRGAADQRRRVRSRCRRGIPHPAGAPGGDGRGDLRPLDGGDRRDPRGRRRPAGRGAGRDLGAGRSVPADPPDLPARPPADPGPDRLARWRG